MVSQPILELQYINKSFGHVHANKNISLIVYKGNIHGIIGENGAGKSTLMSIVYGFYQADSGNIKINNSNVIFNSPSIKVIVDAFNKNLGGGILSTSNINDVSSLLQSINNVGVVCVFGDKGFCFKPNTETRVVSAKYIWGSVFVNQARTFNL